MRKRPTKAISSAIIMSQILLHDLMNSPLHCFRYHSICSETAQNKKSNSTASMLPYLINFMTQSIGYQHNSVYYHYHHSSTPHNSPPHRNLIPCYNSTVQSSSSHNPDATCCEVLDVVSLHGVYEGMNWCIIIKID